MKERVNECNIRTDCCLRTPIVPDNNSSNVSLFPSSVVVVAPFLLVIVYSEYPE